MDAAIITLKNKQLLHLNKVITLETAAAMAAAMALTRVFLMQCVFVFIVCVWSI